MADKAKRTVLTPAQRVERARAEVDRLEAIANARASKAADKLLEKRSALTIRVNDLLGKIEDIDTELASYGVGTDPFDTERVEQIDEDVDV